MAGDENFTGNPVKDNLGNIMDIALVVKENGDCTRLEDVSWINRHKTTLSFHYKKAADRRYGDNGRADFKTEEQAQHVLEQLIALKP